MYSRIARFVNNEYVHRKYGLERLTRDLRSVEFIKSAKSIQPKANLVDHKLR
jgi:hypothetical protein